MKEIKLSKFGKNREKYTTLVDDWNYDWLNQWNWHVRKGKYTMYAIRHTERINGVQGTIMMHREIMNTPHETDTDHEDHNGLNNQEYNLRNATQTQNVINTAKCRGKTKYKGVCIETNRQNKKIYTYFRAYIKVGDKRLSLGNHKTPESAALAYNTAALNHYGEFAYLNIIEV